MKNLKQKLILCAGIILTGLIAACSSPFDPAEYNAGDGNVLISIAGSNGRTILPEAIGISRYALTVTRTGGSNLTVPTDISGITGAGVRMTLPAGEYTVTVKAYRTSGNEEHIAAQGSKTVTVSSGSAETAVVIDLKPISIGDGGYGFFSYDITLPNEVDTATLKLDSAISSDKVEVNLKNGAVSSTPVQLPVGYYDLSISLTKDAKTAGEYAAVHIYSGMESKAVLDLSNGFDTINLDTLKKVIDDVQKELARLADGGDIKTSVNGSDVAVGLLWVTQAQATALQSALTTAQGVVTTPPAKQSPVNAARKTLEDALAAFKAALQPGKKVDNGSWTALITEVGTPVSLSVTSGTAYTLAVPLANINITNGSYNVTDGKINFARDGSVFAVGTPSAAGDLTLSFNTAVLGVNTVTLTKGTAAAPKGDIEFLYSGIWTNTGTQPAITYISADQWTFSNPSENVKVNGKFRIYDRKAAFYKEDGSFFAVGRVATEQAELTGNTLYVYPVTGGSFALTLRPYPNPFVGNWQGGATIAGTLYVRITTWSLENASGSVLASGEYVWNGNEAYFLSSGGARFATGTINSAKTGLTVVVNNGIPVYGGATQAFTLIASPFTGTWRATIAIVASVTATVTTNTYYISTSVTSDTAEGQYVWWTENGVRKGIFYSNGYPYGAATMNSGGNQITVNLDEPFDAPVVGTISSLTLNKQ